MTVALQGGPSGQLTPAQVEHIRRTVRHVPEVMVKVLSKGGQDLRSVGKHVDYIDRHGKLPLETDDGERLFGQASKMLLAEGDAATLAIGICAPCARIGR